MQNQKPPKATSKEIMYSPLRSIPLLRLYIIFATAKGTVRYNANKSDVTV